MCRLRFWQCITIIFIEQHRTLRICNGRGQCSLWCTNWSTIYTIQMRFMPEGSGGYSPASHSQDLGSIPGQFLVTYFAGKLALGHVFLGALRFSPVSIIPPLSHTHLQLHVPPTRRANVRKPGNLQIKQSFHKSEALSRKIFSLLMFVKVRR